MIRTKTINILKCQFKILKVFKKTKIYYRDINVLNAHKNSATQHYYK